MLSVCFELNSNGLTQNSSTKVFAKMFAKKIAQ